jgi:hypothetical protein
VPRKFDRHKARHLIENFFAKLKQFRAIATRYDKPTRNFLAAPPGVSSVLTYLKSLSYHPNPNCEPGHHYLLNNYDPGYFGNGEVDTVGKFVIPPVSTPRSATS